MPPQTPQQTNDPYAEFGGSVATAPAQTASIDPYAEFGGKASSPVISQPSTPDSPQPSSWQVLTQPTDKTDNEYLSYKGLPGILGATIHGLNKVAGDTVGAVKGAVSATNPIPQTPGEAAATAILPGVGAPLYRLTKGAADTAKQAAQVPATLKGINKESSDPLGTYANAAEDTVSQGAGQALAGIAGDAIANPLIKYIDKAPISADITANKYSPKGDAIAASMRPNVKIDVPAEAHIAQPAIEEGLADRGYSANDFQGRNGPKVLQSGIDNALDIHEARAKQVIDPIRNEPIDPKVLAENPELKARFGDKENITYGDLDAERIKMNKELKRANFYSKDPTAQAAVGDNLDNTQEAVNQARDLVYGKAEQTTGINLRPLKQTESALLKMKDLSNSTANGLSAQEAKFQATPGYKKLAQSAKKVIALKSNPISSFASYETPGLTSPTETFNSNMQKAFPDLKPLKANKTVTFPNYNLNLTNPPGETPMPIFQRMLLNATQGVGDVHDVPGPAPAVLTPSGDMPPDAQRVLPLTSGAPASQIYPGLRYPKGKQ